MRKVAKYLPVTLAVIIIIVFLGFKKNINLKGMHIHQTPHFTIYYEELDQKTLEDIERKLETSYPDIQNFFGSNSNSKGKIIVYNTIERFQRAYLGRILSAVYGDWAVGAAYQDTVLVTSPENPGAHHTYDDILDVVLHEHVHTVVYQQNEMANIWLDEGVATYLAGQESELPPEVPEFAAMQAEDQSTFLENDGYAFSYKYVEFLESTYGSEKIVQLIKTNDYEAVFGKTALEVYTEWVLYMGEESSTKATGTQSGSVKTGFSASLPFLMRL